MSANPPASPGTDATNAVLEEILSRDHVLLYSDTGKPILKNSDLWRAAEAEWRTAVEGFLKGAQSKVQPGPAPTSPEQLIEQLQHFAKSDPKYSIDVVDGSLSIPLQFNVRGISIRGHIPLYTLATAAIGLWFAKKAPDPQPQADNEAPSVKQVNREVFRTWRTIKVGTFRKASDLHEALQRARVEFDDQSERLVRRLHLVSRATSLPLIIATPKALGIDGPVRTEELHESARRHGLYVVPAEVGPQVCLQVERLHPTTPLLIGMIPFPLRLLVTGGWSIPPTNLHFSLKGGPTPATKLLTAVETSSEYDPNQPFVWCADPGWEETERIERELALSPPIRIGSRGTG